MAKMQALPSRNHPQDERSSVRHLPPRRKQPNPVRGGGRVVLWLALAGNASLAGVLLRRVRYGADDVHLLRGASAGDDDGVDPPCDVGAGGPSEGVESFALARRQSFGFFDDVTAEHWGRWREIYLGHEDHRYPDKPLSFNPDAKEDQVRPEIYKMRDSEWSGWHSYAAWYQNNYEPNFSCPFEKRVGAPMNGDGPKWVCDPHRIRKRAEARKAEDPDSPGCVVYSVGSNGDFSFELGLQNEVGEDTCEFHIFDPGFFEESMPPELRRAHYHRWELGKEKAAEASRTGWGFRKKTKASLRKAAKASRTSMRRRSLPEIVKLLGHEDLDVIDVFKIDCEGCEWTTYKDWLSDGVPMLHQIQVEVHGAPVLSEAGAIDFFDSLERAGYLRFHKEPNIQWGPNNIEYSFVKVEKEFVEGKNSNG